MAEKRYQVFISSTYTDLKDERQAVIQTLMEMDCIPAGMELFPATDQNQFEFIKRIIDDCDYYLLIIGGRYGSETAEGISYTEKEYDYAVEKGIKVIALIHNDIGNLPSRKVDGDPEIKKRLNTFRDKAKTGRIVRFWENSDKLPGIVAVSLANTIKMYPAVGWVRADQKDHELLKHLEDTFEISKDTKYYHNLTVDTHQLEKYKKVLKYYNKAIELDPKDFTAYYNRGNVIANLGQHEEAIKDFDKVIKLNPKSSATYYNRGNSQERLGQHKEAIKDYDQAIKLDSKYFASYCNRGSAMGTLGQYEEAIKDFDQAIKLDPKDSTAYNNRGIFKERLGQHKEAIRDFNEAVKLNPMDSMTYYYRGNTMANLGQYEEAIKDYDHAIKLDPKDSTIYNNRGGIKEKLSQHEKAIKDFDQAIKLNSKFSAAYYNRGLTFKNWRQYKEAREDLLNAKELCEKQNNTELLEAIKRSLQELNEAEKSRLGSACGPST